MTQTLQAQNVESLSAVEHFLLRPELYMPIGKELGHQLTWSIDGRLVPVHSSIDHEQIHMFKEILGNAVDAMLPESTIDVILSTKPCKENPYMTDIEISVNNMCARYIKSEDLQSCFFNFMTGSNFKTTNGIGRNGIGAKIVPILADEFSVKSYENGKCTSLYVKNYKDHKVPPEPVVSSTNENVPRICITWMISVSNFSCNVEGYEPTVIQFALGRGVTINWKHVDNDILVVNRRMKDLWSSLPALIGSGTMTSGTDGEIEYYIGDRGEECLKNVPNFTIINGLYCLNKSSAHHTHYVSKIVTKLCEKFERAASTFNSAFVNNNFLIIYRFNDSDCTFSSQSKDTIIKLSIKMESLRIPSIIGNWTTFKNLFHKLRIDTLSKAKKLSVAENTNYVPPTTKTYDTLLIGEGDSTRGYLNVMREKMGVSCTGIFVLMGKCRNFIDIDNDIIASNKIAVALMSALNITLLSSEGIQYRNIVIAADADDDGKHIITLVYTLFAELWPELISRVQVLMSFVEREYYGKSIIRRSSEFTGSCAHGNILRYFKGLGSCELPEIEDDYRHAPVLRISPTPDSIEQFKLIMGSGNQSRRNLLLIPDDQIIMPQCHRTLQTINDTKECFEFNLIWKLFYRSYMKRSIERSIPSWNDGLKDCIRKLIRTIKSRKPIEQKVDSLANATSEACDYHHGSSSLSAAIIRLAQQYHTQLPILIGQGQFGTVNGGDCAASRYLSVTPATYFKYLFPFKSEQCILPYALINGTSGIASGWQSNIPHVPVEQLLYNIEGYLKSNDHIFAFDVPHYYHGSYEITNNIVITKPAWGQTMQDIKNALNKNEIRFNVGEHGYIYILDIGKLEYVKNLLRVTAPRNITFQRNGIVVSATLEQCVRQTIKMCLAEYNAIDLEEKERHVQKIKRKEHVMRYCIKSSGIKFKTRNEIKTFAHDIAVDFENIKNITDIQKTDESIEELRLEIDEMRKFEFDTPIQRYTYALTLLKSILGRIDSKIHEFALSVKAE